LTASSGAEGPYRNRVAAEIETAIIDHALEHNCHGAMRVEQELRLKGVKVSSGGVRGVWMRHSLLTKHERLLRLEKVTCPPECIHSDGESSALMADG
jgi:hypothetical protein